MQPTGVSQPVNVDDYPVESTVIHAYATYYEIEATKNGYFHNGQLNLDDITALLRIPVFDNRGRYVDSIRYYRYIGGKYRFPINTLSWLKTKFERLKLDYPLFEYAIQDHEPNHKIGAAIHIPAKMKDGWVDRPEHAPAFEHILNYPGHIVGNDLQTGKGKSYVGCKLTTKWQCPTAIVCDGLLDQWVENYLEKTNVPAERIYLIQGIDSIIRLWKMIENKEPLPWVIVCSIRTMSRYGMYIEDSYRSVPRVNDLFKALNIGYVLYDEIHLNTHAIVLLMLVLNIDKSVLLSATPERSDRMEQNIFEFILPKGLIGGAAEYDRYVDACIRGFELDLHVNPKQLETYGYGYNHMKYESKILDNNLYIREFVNELIKVIQSEFLPWRNSDTTTKCLIFVSTVRFATEVKKRLSAALEGIDIRTYLASDPIDNLTEAEIIISTPKSCGVGKDIKRLLTGINTISLGSAPLYQQMFGRLRKVEGLQCRWVDMINKRVPQQMKHFFTKRKILNKCSKTLTTSFIDTKQRGRG